MLISIGLSAQKRTKPWVEWTKKEAQKILNDSPWGQTQVDTDTSEMVYTPTTQTGGGDSSSRREQGATNQATSVTYRIRWLSARPIREALARQIQLDTGNLTEQLRFFAEGPSDKRAVIAVTFEFNDQRFGAKVMQAFNSIRTDILRNNTYLERKDGQRIFLQEYVAPQQNPLGAAMFIFPRTVEGRSLLSEDTGSVRFHSEFENKVDVPVTRAGDAGVRSTNIAGVTNQRESTYKFLLDMKFKVAQMLYDGQLEY